TDSSADLIVDGSGSSVTVGSFQVGDNSTNAFAIHVAPTSSGAVLVSGAMPSTIHSNGSVAIGAAASTGTWTPDGDLVVDGGSLVVHAGSNVEVSAGKLLTLANFGMLSGGGGIGGNVENTSGQIAPGPMTSAFTINGDYVQGSAGKVAL